MSEFVIATPNDRWLGFKTIGLVRSMERAADELAATFTSNHSGDIQQALNESIAVQIFLDNELLLTGNGTARSPSYDATSIDLAFNAKSRLDDLVACSLPGKQFKGQTFLAVANHLCGLFGIEVQVDSGVNANQVLRQPSLDEGQPIWDFLESEARALALRLMSTAQGHLLITRTGARTAADRLVLGENVLQGSADFNHDERFSEYIVMGSQSRGNELLSASNMNITRGVAKDEHVNRYRPLTIMADDDLDAEACERRAQWQRNTHYGRSQSITYTVDGWQQSNGETWQTNMLVEMNDPVMGINGNRLITETRMRLIDTSGKKTDITVMPPEAMQLVKLPPKAEKKEVGLSAL